MKILFLISAFFFLIGGVGSWLYLHRKNQEYTALINQEAQQISNGRSFCWAVPDYNHPDTSYNYFCNASYAYKTTLMASYWQAHWKREPGRRPIHVGIIFPGTYENWRFYYWSFQNVSFEEATTSTSFGAFGRGFDFRKLNDLCRVVLSKG